MAFRANSNPGITNLPQPALEHCGIASVLESRGRVDDTGLQLSLHRKPYDWASARISTLQRASFSPVCTDGRFFCEPVMTHKLHSIEAAMRVLHSLSSPHSGWSIVLQNTVSYHWEFYKAKNTRKEKMCWFRKALKQKQKNSHCRSSLPSPAFLPVLASLPTPRN